ncbi:expressed protein [Phakopsora pachyrhizi]|uniref:Expressed protein n=1 Tax=Phakopsora pachyrhizi TaxID=170000 RepID=A0AAV0BE39_PHAPC|nr:expressed protein [Phakopsora pachyrhizi]CAH7684162.1 expressed protein [Phakopsora pachyrhizi]
MTFMRSSSIFRYIYFFIYSIFSLFQSEDSINRRALSFLKSFRIKISSFMKHFKVAFWLMYQICFFIDIQIFIMC